MQQIRKQQEQQQPNKCHSYASTMSVQATLHEGHSLFSASAGRQCTCNALMFKLYTLHSIPQNWNTSIMNQILREGNTLYIHLSKQLKQEYLPINEFPQYIEYNFTNNEIARDDPYHGTMQRNTTEVPFFSLNGSCSSHTFLYHTVRCRFSTQHNKYGIHLSVIERF